MVFSKSNSIRKYKDHPVLVGPNLGKPQILSFPGRRLDETETFEVDLLYIAPYSATKESIRYSTQERVEIRPLVKLDPEKKRAIRGQSIIGQIKSIIKAPIVPLSDPELVLNYPHESPRGIPVREQIYADKTSYFSVVMVFEFTDEIKKIIAEFGYVMCDLFQTYPEEANLSRTNYHSVVLSQQTWENCNLIHGTDLHVSKRNDEILPVMLKGLDKSVSKKLLQFGDMFNTKYSDRVEDRFINPNNNLRLFILLMNRLHERKQVDAIFLTGDLIDYCIRSDGGDNIVSFDLPNTNWNVFRNIILNFPITYRSDIEPLRIYPNEELMVPIFTITGNHDYRSYHYDLRWGGLHHVVNVRALEMMHYNDIVPANPISSLYINRKTMMAYNQYLNPCQNYYVQLGDHTFLMMDSQYDSAKATRDLFMGSPSCAGLTNNQVQFMKNVISLKAGSRGVRMAMFHAPNINALPLKSMSIKQQVQYKKFGLNKLEDFKEDALKKKTGGEGRSDPYIQYNHGCIANNWEESIDFFNKNKILVINGHTHKFFEFRTETTDEKSLIRENKYLIIQKTINVPAAIYMDDYSLKHKNSDYFNQKLPFHLQTPSLGVGTYMDTNLTGAFRIMKIRDNKLDSFRVDFLSNYKQLLPEIFSQRSNPKKDPQ